MTTSKTQGSQNRQRTKQAVLPCTPEERAEIEARAEKAGLTVSGYLRALVFGADTPQPRAAKRATVQAETLQRILAELGKTGGNLNQIARRVNQNLGFDAPIFAELSAELRYAVRALLAALGKEPADPGDAGKVEEP
jgi:hypothetical protein